MALLAKATALAAKAVLVRIPLGDGWRKEGREEPDHHRSTWGAADFAHAAATQRHYDYFGNPYAFVEIDAAATRERMLDDAGNRLAALERRLDALLGKRSATAKGAAS
jgi:hypothetical protein